MMSSEVVNQEDPIGPGFEGQSGGRRSVAGHPVDSFFAAVGQMVVVADLWGGIVQATDAIAERLGRYASELAGESIYPFFPPPMRQLAGQMLNDAWTAGVAAGSISMNARSGESVHLLMRVIRGSWAGNVAMFVLLDDPFDPFASREVFQKFFNVVPASMAIRSMEDDRYIDVNDRFVMRSELTREEIVGKTLLEIGVLAEPERYEEMMDALRRNPKGDPMEVKIRPKSGDERFLSLTTDQIQIEGRLYALSVSWDITDLKVMEQKLRGALAEVHRLNEEMAAENKVLLEELRAAHSHEEITMNSAAMKAVLARAERVAATNASVLIQGETGTGKELLVRAIHKMSGRRDHPLIIVNCAALPATLVESELFGREKGAYTGALTRQAGRFEAAHRGTLFLDEIGELPLEIQSKFLRVLQEGRFERLGGSATISVDVRVVAATNRNLANEVKAGRFREDLFYRLSVFPIEIPPLRERTEDIPALVWRFIKEFGEEMGKRITHIDEESLKNLESYRWPGNIRELRNVIERAMIETRSKTLSIEIPAAAPHGSAPAQSLKETERRLIVEALEQSAWRVRGDRGAAEKLGLKPSTLESKMKKLGISRP